MLKVDIILSSKLAVSEVYACVHYGIVAGKTRALAKILRNPRNSDHPSLWILPSSYKILFGP